MHTQDPRDEPEIANTDAPVEPAAPAEPLIEATAPEPPDADQEAEQEAEQEAGAEADPRDGEILELREKLLRAMAETENVRRRLQRDKDDALKYAVSRFAGELCEVADNLRRAVESVAADAAAEPAIKSLLDGVAMTERSLLDVFERHGVRAIDPTGERFDPNLHEAMTEIEMPDAEPGTVLQVFQIGYVMHDRLLRPARVVVVKAARPPEGGSVDTLA